jgi:hypothetical protein
MTPETEARVRSVQKFGRYARSICGFFAVMLCLLLFGMTAVIVSGPMPDSGLEIGLGAYNVTAAQLTTLPIKLWSFVVMMITVGVVAWILLHLHRLFGQLAAGQIYTKHNVWHLRQIGLLMMAMAVFQLILPLISFVLVEVGFIDRALVTFVDSNGEGNALLTGWTSFGGFIPAALVLLASWIMDVGREVSEDAEVMRREAELVV